MLFHYRPDTWTSFGISLNIYGLLVFHRVSQPIWNAKVMMKNRMKRMIPKSLTDFHCHRTPSHRSRFTHYISYVDTQSGRHCVVILL
mmetsp:Transcript_3805/g.8541  ORF Transcript_3805/g.8541 Transcript_3805/m.8541 type:complete len:87 (+) Transcript_3805:1445-1705(+)